ncbi:MAG: SDR family NAD(P)-dependent oxidoreductase [Planctomycetes bacterium]|nr:SDR family NAD(P)-dependent oxidoreductase [Planctomycetota bacterium]
MAQFLSGRVALVTGASSGIGWELGRQLALDGCKVGLVARREAPLHELAARIVAAGGTAVPVVADVGAREQVGAAFAAVRDRLGPVDLVVANAGVGRPTLRDPVNMGDVEDTFRINLMGVVYTLSAALPEMLARKSGHLVAVSSLAGYRGLPAESAYCASKAAVNVYMDGLRIHLRGTGVRATTICPGFVTTPMTASNKFHMPQLMTAEYAARKMIRAIKAGKKVYNFPWRLHLMVKLSRWLPDGVINWVMGDYESEAKEAVAGRQKQEPPVP